MTRGDVRNRILGAAEAQFAQRGYHGVSMRQVADEAGTSVSLAQYHFKTKDALYRAVMERRILSINHDRLQRLDALEVKRTQTGELQVEEVLRAFLEPTVLLSRDKASGGSYYAQLLSQMTNDPQPHARETSRAFTDPIARQTMRVLHLALPELDRPTLTWCYLFAVGSMIAAISPTGRAALLSNGECDPDDVLMITGLLVPFITGAFERIAVLARAGRLPSQAALRAMLPRVPDEPSARTAAPASRKAAPAKTTAARKAAAPRTKKAKAAVS